MMMRAVLRWVNSPDIDDLRTFQPATDDSFGFLLQFGAGPEGEDGAESFSMVICTPQWLIENHTSADVVIGRHRLIVFRYDYDRIIGFLEAQVAAVRGMTWTDVAEKLGRIGRWEFEDYVK